jgi:MFS family permease
VRSLFGAPTNLVLCAAFPCFVFGLWLIYGWLPTFLHDKFALTQADAAWNATIYLQSTTAIGLLGGGVLSDWLYGRTPAARQWVLVASLLLSAPSLYLIGAGETLPATRVAAAAFGLTSGLFLGNIFAAAFEIVPADLRASAVGILNLFGGMVSGFATLFGGMWKKTIGIDGLLGATALAYFAALRPAGRVFMSLRIELGARSRPALQRQRVIVETPAFSAAAVAGASAVLETAAAAHPPSQPRETFTRMTRKTQGFP